MTPIVLTRRRDLIGVQTVRTWAAFRRRGPFDAIFVTNETERHLETMRRCLALNPRAVFVEKPISHTARGLAEVIRRFRARRVSCWVGYCMQFSQPLAKVKVMLDHRILGKVYAIRVSVGQDLRQWRSRDYRESYSSRSRAGGGVMLDLVHDFNYPAWLLGESLRPIAAVVGNRSTLRIAREDCAESLLVSASGVIVSLHQDYLRMPGKRSLEIIASRGTLEWDTCANVLRLWRNGVHTVTRTPPDRGRMYRAEMDFFLRALRSGKYFSNADEAMRDVRCIEALKRYAGNHPRR